MRILFFQYAYHTNRHPMVKSFVDRGHEVKYISQFTNPDREYRDYVNPVSIGYSRLFEFIAKKTNSLNFGTKMKYGWPPVKDLWNIMSGFDPDIVIVRNYGLPQAVVLLFANVIGANCIVQEQNPKWKRKTNSIKTKADSIYEKIFQKPLIRVTPVRGEKIHSETTKNVYYVPFPIDSDLHHPLGKDNYFKSGYVNIICVAKLDSERKNILRLLKCFKSLLEEYELSLTVVGKLHSENDPYYQKILSYISDNDLNAYVDIYPNMDYDGLQREYKQHDLYVLPSQNEPAAVSPVEAMAGGLAVICSDTNGTQYYVQDGWNGFVFRTNSDYDLSLKLELAIRDRDNLIRMGKNSVSQVQNHHLMDKYYERMVSIIEDEFHNV